MRGLVERLTRGLVFRRRVPPEFGGARLYVSASGGLRYLFRPMRRIDPDLFGLAREFVRRGDTVWDVGANLGLFSVVAAHFAGPTGQVVAVEPDAWLVQLLRRSAGLQAPGSAPMQVVPVAAARAEDLRTFHIAARSRSANFLSGHGSSQTGGVAEVQIVPTVTLDWLSEHLARPDVVKIDVEGAELEVLEGAAHLLQTARPIVLCEVGREQADGVSAIFARAGYRLYDGEQPAGRREEIAGARWNTIAVPVERDAGGGVRG